MFHSTDFPQDRNVRPDFLEQTAIFQVIVALAVKVKKYIFFLGGSSFSNQYQDTV